MVCQNFGKHPNLYPRDCHFYKWCNTHVRCDDFKQCVTSFFAFSFAHLPLCFAYPMVVTLLIFFCNFLTEGPSMWPKERCVVLLGSFPLLLCTLLWYYLWLVIGEGPQGRGSTLADDCHKNPWEGRELRCE